MANPRHVRYVFGMDLRRMEELIDGLEPAEIDDALGLLRLFERVGQSTAEEAEHLRLRVEARAGSFRNGRRGLRLVRS